MLNVKVVNERHPQEECFDSYDLCCYPGSAFRAVNETYGVVLVVDEDTVLYVCNDVAEKFHESSWEGVDFHKVDVDVTLTVR